MTVKELKMNMESYLYREKGIKHDPFSNKASVVVAWSASIRFGRVSLSFLSDVDEVGSTVEVRPRHEPRPGGAAVQCCRDAIEPTQMFALFLD